ncbi:MAG TPA: type II toxin-antitoxin system VapC family toxin [Candidatus Sulfotelmatobacter sp.]|jgi:ribonuclease VapC
MIVDTSAIIAILRDEPESPVLAQAVDRAKRCRISAVSYVEAAVVIDSGRSPISSRRFDDFVRELEIVIEPVTADQARIARDAYRDWGKGRHKAGLNLGDCFAYALAKAAGEPLLFKGNDFRHTDIEPAQD